MKKLLTETISALASLLLFITNPMDLTRVQAFIYIAIYYIMAKGMLVLVENLRKVKEHD